MDISSSGHINGQDPPENNPQRNQIEKEGASTRNEGDQIDISSRAKEIKRAVEAVKQVPDIRASKIEAIKRAVDSGTYDVKSEKTAENLLKEMQQEMTGLLNPFRGIRTIAGGDRERMKRPWERSSIFWHNRK
jgi:negative regulator of flagellin synthesis FlgM